jgi:hypothetical protein
MQDTPKFIKRHKKIIGNFVEFFQEFLNEQGCKKHSWGYTQQTENRPRQFKNGLGLRPKQWVGLLDSGVASIQTIRLRSKGKEMKMHSIIVYRHAWKNREYIYTFQQAKDPFVFKKLAETKQNSTVPQTPSSPASLKLPAWRPVVAPPCRSFKTPPNLKNFTRLKSSLLLLFKSANEIFNN